MTPVRLEPSASQSRVKHPTTELLTGPRSAVGNYLATDANLTADPGVGSSILAWSHTFMEIDHEIIYTSFYSLPLNYS